MINYLNKLKEKCNVDSNLIEIIEDLFQKLIHFGYITPSGSKKLKKKLYNNIDTIIIGNRNSPDYKSGYYDAIKKELYIKDISNIESIYLRILYAITSKEISKEVYHIGYSSSSLSKKSYKIDHLNFGINRAVVSNLVCRLLYTLPTTLSIVPTYRSYENDFLGNRINSDNDIYFIEGKILTQICYVFEINEENLYLNLFSKSPVKHLHKAFSKVKDELITKLLGLFDSLSQTYSNYNKLCYLNRLLDTNYLNIKKNILNNDISALEIEQSRIKVAIKTALNKLLTVSIEDTDENINIESSLAEKINSLEESILLIISNLQDILVNNLISRESSYSPIAYAIKLKELDEMTISKNQKLKDATINTITRRLLNTFENTASNLIEKVKYSLINEILSSEKYIKIYKNLSFKKVNFKEREGDFELIAINIDDSFVQLVKVDDLNKSIKDIYKNTTPIKIDNLKYLLDNPSSPSDVHKIERIFTTIKNKHSRVSFLALEDFYLFTLNAKEYILAITKNTFYVIELDYLDDGNVDSKILKLSENYTIFNLHDFSNMPVIYKKQSNNIGKLTSFFTLFLS